MQIPAAGVSSSLNRKIQLLLQHSESLMYREVSSNLLVAGAAVVQERPGEFVLVNEQVLALKRLFALSSPADQAAFAVSLLRLVAEENAAVVAQAVVELGETRLLSRLSGFDRTHVALWMGVRDKLRTEPWLFTDADLEGLREGLSATDRATEPWLHRRGNLALQFRSDLALDMHGRVIPEVVRVIERVEYHRLINDLRGVKSPAAEPDRRLLMSGLWELGFRRAVAPTMAIRRGKAAIEAFRQQSERALPLPSILPGTTGPDGLD